MRAEARPRLLLVGSGDHVMREYALQTLARSCEVVLAKPAPLEWERPYCSAHLVFERDAADVDDRVVAFGRQQAVDGVLTYEEHSLALAARVAARLGLRGNSPAVIATCRDKLAVRTRLARAGVGSARFAAAATLEQAIDAARRIGFPVVLKPRALAGSFGVFAVEDEDALARAWPVVAGASLPGFDALDGCLVEELLDGPEVSVEIVAYDGEIHVAAVTAKELGLAGTFEETGHVVGRAVAEEDQMAIADVARAALAAVGFADGAAHVELRRTSSGPRIIEINARLGGDLIPHLVRLATGIDIVALAGLAACGRRPTLAADRDPDRSAAVRFSYPPYDCRVVGIEHRWQRDERPDWLERLVFEVQPGAELLAPPRSFLGRLAFAVVVGSGPQECRRRLDEVEAGLVLELEPLTRRER